MMRVSQKDKRTRNMKVVCIKKYKSMGFQHQLTYGKTYDILEWSIDKKSVYIINDRGQEDIFYITNFLSQDEWREKQLNELFL